MGVYRLRVSVSLSVLVHGAFLLAWAALLGNRATLNLFRPPTKTTWIEVVPDSRSQRIVQTVPGEKTEKAKPNAFLGERTQTVDRQTVGKGRTLREGGAQSVAPNAETKSKYRLRPLARFGIAMPNAETPPAPDAPQWALGESPPQDYVKGLNEGDRTALNTREYIFYGYFQRIRERLDRAWGSALRNKMEVFFRRGRRLASDMDHVTRTLVTLNAQGEVVRVQVVEESGTQDLDDSAVQAFNKAGPFPNPPKGMISKNGAIEIRWDFVLRN